MNAHDIVYQARRKGLLVPQPCARCGNIKSVAHHEDYSKPLKVVWLCHTHHRLRHSEIENEIARLEKLVARYAALACKARTKLRRIQNR